MPKVPHRKRLKAVKRVRKQPTNPTSTNSPPASEDRPSSPSNDVPPLIPVPSPDVRPESSLSLSSQYNDEIVSAQSFFFKWCSVQFCDCCVNNFFCVCFAQAACFREDKIVDQEQSVSEISSGSTSRLSDCLSEASPASVFRVRYYFVYILFFLFFFDRLLLCFKCILLYQILLYYSSILFSCLQTVISPDHSYAANVSNASLCDESKLESPRPISRSDVSQSSVGDESNVGKIISFNQTRWFW